MVKNQTKIMTIITSMKSLSMLVVMMRWYRMMWLSLMKEWYYQEDKNYKQWSYRY